MTVSAPLPRLLSTSASEPLSPGSGLSCWAYANARSMSSSARGALATGNRKVMARAVVARVDPVDGGQRSHQALEALLRTARPGSLEAGGGRVRCDDETRRAQRTTPLTFPADNADRPDASGGAIGRVWCGRVRRARGPRCDRRQCGNGKQCVRRGRDGCLSIAGMSAGHACYQGRRPRDSGGAAGRRRPSRRADRLTRIPEQRRAVVRT